MGMDGRQGPRVCVLAEGADLPRRKPARKGHKSLTAMILHVLVRKVRGVVRDDPAVPTARAVSAAPWLRRACAIDDGVGAHHTWHGQRRVHACVAGRKR